MNKTRLVLTCLLVAGEFLLITCNSSSPSSEAMKRGEQIYKRTCLPCHQGDGSGVPGLNPPVKNSEYVAGEPVQLIGIVINGLNKGVEINGNVYTNTMPSFRNDLNDNEIADVLTYIRNSFGNKAGKISADEVKAERK